MDLLDALADDHVPAAVWLVAGSFLVLLSADRTGRRFLYVQIFFFILPDKERKYIVNIFYSIPILFCLFSLIKHGMWFRKTSASTITLRVLFVRKLSVRKKHNNTKIETSANTH